MVKSYSMVAGGLILASRSPRRRQLLQQLGLSFTVVEPRVGEEDWPVSGLPAEVVEGLARRKARSVRERVKAGIIIGADTVVVVDNKILGKPRDAEEAVAMLEMLQGRRHEVYTGVAVMEAAGNRELVAHERTVVVMRPATRVELQNYVATGEPLDKAGAYAIQGIGAVFVQAVEGCYYNVVGLPLYLLWLLLKEIGYDYWREVAGQHH